MYDLLLLNTHRRLEASNDYTCDWLGIYHLATFLEHNGFPSRAYAGYAHEIEGLLQRELLQGVKVVGFSCDYENKETVRQFCRYVRDIWHVPVLVGGPQAIALGEEFLRDTGVVAVVQGEGELPMLGLMQYCVDHTGSLECIPGIKFLHEGALRCTPPPKPIQNLDALPYIDPGLVLDKRFRRETASILTARGCPFRCAFCFEGSTTRGVRWRSVANVMGEVESILKRSPQLRFLLFTDDTFTLNRQRVREFAKALRALRQEYNFVWFAEAHVATILRHPDMVEELVEAGMASMQIGIESGVERTLRAYNKKTTPAMIAEAVDICYAAQLPHLIGNIIIGGAFETESGLLQSQEFVLDLYEKAVGMLEVHAVHFWPLPQTAMTTRGADFGLEVLDPESLTAAADYPVVRCGSLTRERLSEVSADMQKAFDDKMNSLCASIPRARMIRMSHLFERYRFSSGWFHALARQHREKCNFCARLASGAASLLEDIPPTELSDWHPCRTCPPIFRQGRGEAAGIPLSAREYAVFVASAGRMTVRQVTARCHLPEAEVLHILAALQENMLITFSKY